MKVWQELTDMFNSHQIFVEMEKKYKNSWLELNNDNVSEMVKFRGNDSQGNFIFEDVYENHIVLNKDTTCKVFVPILAQGLYQCNNVMLHARYSAARQYRRGLSADSIIIVEPVSNTHISIHSFMKYYKQQTYPLSVQKAMKILKNTEKSSQTLSRNFGIVRTQDAFLFLYQDVIIGKIVENTIKVTHKQFYQEVMDSQRLIDYTGYEVLYE